MKRVSRALREELIKIGKRELQHLTEATLAPNLASIIEAYELSREFALQASEKEKQRENSIDGDEYDQGADLNMVEENDDGDGTLEYENGSEMRPDEDLEDEDDLLGISLSANSSGVTLPPIVVSKKKDQSTVTSVPLVKSTTSSSTPELNLNPSHPSSPEQQNPGPIDEPPTQSSEPAFDLNSILPPELQVDEIPLSDLPFLHLPASLAKGTSLEGQTRPRPTAPRGMKRSYDQMAERSNLGSHSSAFWQVVVTSVLIFY